MLKKDPLEKRMCFIWPKDGPKGNRPRGFFSGLSDIISNKGPDIFIQKGNSKRPIKPEVWSNWDSYHSFDAHLAEDQYAKPSFLGGRSRGIERYDPHSRKYKMWDCTQDWNGCIRKRTGWYPRFTESEMEIISSTPTSQHLGAEDLGPDWGNIGPMRFGPEYDYFWGNAHRMGENRFYGLDSSFSPAPYYSFHQTSPFDIQRWINQRGIIG